LSGARVGGGASYAINGLMAVTLKDGVTKNAVDGPTGTKSMEHGIMTHSHEQSICARGTVPPATRHVMTMLEMVIPPCQHSENALAREVLFTMQTPTGMCAAMALISQATPIHGGQPGRGRCIHNRKNASRRPDSALHLLLSRCPQRWTRGAALGPQSTSGYTFTAWRLVSARGRLHKYLLLQRLQLPRMLQQLHMPHPPLQRSVCLLTHQVHAPQLPHRTHRPRLRTRPHLLQLHTHTLTQLLLSGVDAGNLCGRDLLFRRHSGLFVDARYALPPSR